MTVSEEVQKMIQSALESMEVTSANPTHINKLIQVNNIDVSNIDQTIKEEIERVIKDIKQDQGVGVSKNVDTSESIKDKKKLILVSKSLKKLDEGNVGDVTRMTSAQFGNIKSFALNPAGFLIGTVMRKAFKGAGVLLLATLIFEAVKFIIAELLKPGRLLDIRFKRDIRREMMFFRLREQQQKLRQGFSRVIVTTMPGLRGGQNQTGDSFAPLGRGDFEIVGDGAGPYQLSPPIGPPLSLGKYTGAVTPGGLRRIK